VNFRKPILFVLAILFLLMIMPKAGAQEYGIIQATATVIAGITITGDHDLIFGSVLPGVDKSIDRRNIGFAGAWHISGNNLAEITIDFTLPDSLLHIDSLAFLRIAFNSTDASYDDGTGGGQASPAVTFNPNGPGTANLGAGGILDVWIGGTVEPTISQTGGNYVADITLMVAYTGN
jgi:hypothetical protein